MFFEFEHIRDPRKVSFFSTKLKSHVACGYLFSFPFIFVGSSYFLRATLRV